ncbi:MAG: hypothetical protein GVY28_08775, partial [Alphaproteobacteria bacterium]|jgi:hypothetical protein|nr:hypothetical protein [Alphaproteobacteria bacterium]
VLEQFFEDLAGVKPGEGPTTGWEDSVYLDVNGDGFVDKLDRQLLIEEGETPVYLVEDDDPPSEGDTGDGAVTTE